MAEHWTFERRPLGAEEVREALMALSASERDRVLYGLRAEQRNRKLQERDIAILELGTGFALEANTGRAKAARIHHALTSYAAAAWLLERQRDTASIAEGHRLLHRILLLNDGRVPGEAQLRNILAGLRSRS